MYDGGVFVARITDEVEIPRKEPGPLENAGGSICISDCEGGCFEVVTIAEFRFLQTDNQGICCSDCVAHDSALIRVAKPANIPGKNREQF